MNDRVLRPRAPDHRAGFGERDRAEQGIDAADHPGGEEEPGRRQMAGDLARGAEDADTDRVADEDGEAERDAEDLVELAAAGQWE